VRGEQTRKRRNIDSKITRAMTPLELRHQTRVYQYFRTLGWRESEIAMTLADMARTKIVRLGRALANEERAQKEDKS